MGVNVTFYDPLTSSSDLGAACWDWVVILTTEAWETSACPLPWGPMVGPRRQGLVRAKPATAVKYCYHSGKACDHPTELIHILQAVNSHFLLCLMNLWNNNNTGAPAICPWEETCVTPQPWYYLFQPTWNNRVTLILTVSFSMAQCFLVPSMSVMAIASLVV